MTCTAAPGHSRLAELRFAWVAAAAMFVAGLSVVRPAAADEGGVSFWLPGQQGSFAAVPGEPGWSLPIIYYHASSDAEASRAFQIGGRTALGLEAKADLFLFAPSYVFADPVAGGQASVGLTGLFGRMKVDASATLTGPNGDGHFRQPQRHARRHRRSLSHRLAQVEPRRPRLPRLHDGRRAGGLVPAGAPRQPRHQPLVARPWAAATRISMPRRVTSCRRCSASPSTAKTTTPATRTAPARTSTGLHRSSCPSNCTSGWSATSITS